MNKLDEINDPKSCLNKAADDEPIFVLRAKDPLAPLLVRRWAELARGTDSHDQAKQISALRVSGEMEKWFRMHIGCDHE